MNVNSPLVTIGLPFYKDNPFLAYAIQSVINQTYQNWEMILVDDGGEDGSVDIARSFHDSRIKLISDGENKGLAARLNEISELALGEYVARMDADDIMTVDRVESQVSYLVNHPDVDVVGSSAIVINERNEIIHTINQKGITNSFIHPTVMGRKSWFQSNPYNTLLTRCQDYELWLRTSRFSVFYNLPAPLLFYREPVTLSYEKEIISHVYLRRIYADYQKFGKSFSWYLKQLILSHVKDGAYFLVEKLNLMASLNRYRWHRELPLSMMLSHDDLTKCISSNYQYK